jgi:hypothetical protein
VRGELKVLVSNFKVSRVSFIEKVTFEERFERSEEICHRRRVWLVEEKEVQRPWGGSVLPALGNNRDAHVIGRTQDPGANQFHFCNVSLSLFASSCLLTESSCGLSYTYQE